MQRNNGREPGQNPGLYIFECVMALLYITISCIVLFTQIGIDAISGNLRLALGIILGIYGIFRIYRAIKKYKENKTSGE